MEIIKKKRIKNTLYVLVEIDKDFYNLQEHHTIEIKGIRSVYSNCWAYDSFGKAYTAFRLAVADAQEE